MERASKREDDGRDHDDEMLYFWSLPLLPLPPRSDNTSSFLLWGGGGH